MFRFVQRHEQYSTNFAPIQQLRAKFFREFLLPSRARRSFSRQIKIFAQHKSRNENAFRLCSAPNDSDIFQKARQTKPAANRQRAFWHSGRAVRSVYFFKKMNPSSLYNKSQPGIFPRKNGYAGQSDGGFLLGFLLIFSSRKKSSNRDASFGVNRIHLPS